MQPWDCAQSPRGCCASNNAPCSEASRPREGDEISFSRLSRDPLLPWRSACGCSAKSLASALLWDLAELAEEAAAEGAASDGSSSATAGDVTTAVTPLEIASTAESTGAEDTACVASATMGRARSSGIARGACPAAAAAIGGIAAMRAELSSRGTCNNDDIKREVRAQQVIRRGCVRECTVLAAVWSGGCCCALAECAAHCAESKRRVIPEGIELPALRMTSGRATAYVTRVVERGKASNGSPSTLCAAHSARARQARGGPNRPRRV